MLIGHMDQCTPTLISGWAADTNAPESPVSVVIYVDSQRLATVTCDRHRPDLATLAELRGHLRHGFDYDLDPALDYARVERISVHHARTGEILTDGSRAGQRPHKLSPILVTASARSGTTFLMNRLLQSPRICGAMVPPFEVRLLAYWAYVYRTLTARADFSKSTNPDQPEGNGNWVGSNPYSHIDFLAAFERTRLGSEYFECFIPDFTAYFIRTIIEEYYVRLCAEQEKGNAIYFAEKCNNVERTARRVSRIFFPGTKEIVVVRDPRDIFCSRIAFFREDPNVAFAHVTDSCRELSRVGRHVMEDEIIVTYERLITGEREEFERLSDFLCVPDLAMLDAGNEDTLFRLHATTESPIGSIGRWKDLPREQIQHCNAAWGEFLTQFGYDNMI